MKSLIYNSEVVLSLNTLFWEGTTPSCFACRLAPKRRHVRWLERKLKDLNLYKERQQTILDMIKKRLSQANPNNLPKAANLDSDTISVSSEVCYCLCVTQQIHMITLLGRCCVVPVRGVWVCKDCPVSNSISVETLWLKHLPNMKTSPSLG